MSRLEKIYAVQIKRSGRVYAVCADTDAAFKYLRELEEKHNLAGEVRERTIFYSTSDIPGL